MKANKQNVALFIVPGQSMDTPSASGYFSHKFDFVYEALGRNAWDIRVIVDVYTRKPRRRTKYRLYSLKLSFFVKVLEVALRNPIRLLTGGKRLTFLNRLALEKLYGQVIVKSSASVVLAIGASESLIKACRKQGVRCIEIQHGMLGPGDVKLYWPNGCLPDSFLSWDPYSSQVAEQAGMGAITVGHPDSTAKNPRPWEIGKFVCVSLGLNESKSEDRWGCFPTPLADAIDFLIAAEVPLLIRLHPTIASRSSTAIRLTRWILNRFGEVRVDNPLEVSLAKSIESSFANLTGRSSTWFEFAIAGKPTFVYDSFWAERFCQHASAIKIWGHKKSPIKLLEDYGSLRVTEDSEFEADLTFLCKNLVPINEFVLGLSPK